MLLQQLALRGYSSYVGFHLTPSDLRAHTRKFPIFSLPTSSKRRTTPKSPSPKCSPKCSKRRSLSHAPCCMIFLGGGSTPINASSTMATAKYLLYRLLIFLLLLFSSSHAPSMIIFFSSTPTNISTMTTAKYHLLRFLLFLAPFCSATKTAKTIIHIPTAIIHYYDLVQKLLLYSRQMCKQCSCIINCQRQKTFHDLIVIICYYNIITNQFQQHIKLCCSC